ncbi:hypothetical protein N7486_008826 [Penicillium sp. IBT 16267x]|nr:hypothetical protein N7486_008826 [Penicillium sp. IBT 16267x]
MSGDPQHHNAQWKLASFPNAGNTLAAKAHTGVYGGRVLQSFSVRAAHWVFRQLSEFDEFSPTNLDFAPDPCAATA